MLWDRTSEDLLLTGLQAAVKEAQTGDNNFQPAVYAAIVVSLQEKGYTMTAAQVLSRWTRVCVLM